MAYLISSPPSSSSSNSIFSYSYSSQNPSQPSQTRRIPDNDADLYRNAVDFRDISSLLLTDAILSGFKLVARDDNCGVTLYSRPVENCSMHMMRAEAELPCTPAGLLTYLDASIRRKWDDYIEELRLVRLLPRPRDDIIENNNNNNNNNNNSEMITDVNNTGISSEMMGQLQPGQRRVGLHYMAIRSPIPLVQNRDFEMVVAEEVRKDGTAWLKAFSTPLGYIEPLDPQQSKYVRALMLFSGILAQPITDSIDRERCRVSYVALVHPMGLIPAMVVNMVLSAQMSVLRKLQQFISENPISTLSISIIEERKGNKSIVTNTSNNKSIIGSSSYEKNIAKEEENNNNNPKTRKHQRVSGVRKRLSSVKDRIKEKLLSKL